MQVVYRQIKQSKYENWFIKFDCCHIKNSWVLTQVLMLTSKPWRSIIATAEKCRQLTTGVFGIYNYGNHWPLYYIIYIYIYIYGNNKLQEGKWVNQHSIKIWLGQQLWDVQD